MSVISDLGDIASDYINQKTWSESLRKASFRGVPFGVLGGDFRAGRRVAVHQYPGRDKPYVEDMGRSTRLIRMTGFLVTNSLIYGGGDAKAQRDAMVAAAEKAGPGTLVHPTLGNLTVSVPDGGLQVVERWDQGRFFEINLTFIESGARIFPSTQASTVSLLDRLAKALELSSVLDFARKVIGTVTAVLSTVEGVIRFGRAVVGMVVNVVAGFRELVGRALQDVRSIMGLAGLLTGNYGRYTNGSVSSALVASKKAKDSDATMTDLIKANTANRAKVSEALDSLEAAALALDVSSAEAFSGAVAGVMDALVAWAADPATAIRLLGPLATYYPDAYTSTTPLGQAEAVAQDATAALLRRQAQAAITQVLASYAPASHAEAVATLGQVTAYIDAEITLAGDAGDDDSYLALRALRQGVVASLTTTAGTLAELQTFTFKAPLSSLAMATRLYGNAARQVELIQQARPIHPAFMPTTVKALAD